MSHFTVLVVGDNIEEQLQPYHEYECTGTDDQYVVETDVTEEYLNEYNIDTTSCYRKGSLTICKYDDMFYREPTPEELEQIGPYGGHGSAGDFSYSSKDWDDGKGYRSKIAYQPDGWDKAEVPMPERFDTFLKYLMKYHEFSFNGEYTFLREEDGEVKVLRKTNPNAEWDWWTIGGRWSNYLSDKNNDKHNSLKLGDFCVQTERNKSRDKALKEFKAWQEIKNKHGELTEWKHYQEKYEHGEARELYNNQASLIAYRELVNDSFDNPSRFGKDMDKYVQGVVDKTGLTYALVKDGVWYSRGEMGWFGMSSNEDDDWDSRFWSLLEGLDPDTMLTVVDCHI